MILGGKNKPGEAGMMKNQLKIAFLEVIPHWAPISDLQTTFQPPGSSFGAKNLGLGGARENESYLFLLVLLMDNVGCAAASHDVPIPGTPGQLEIFLSSNVEVLLISYPFFLHSDLWNSSFLHFFFLNFFCLLGFFWWFFGFGFF